MKRTTTKLPYAAPELEVQEVQIMGLFQAIFSPTGTEEDWDNETETGTETEV